MKSIGSAGHNIRNLHRRVSGPIRRSEYVKFTWKNKKINRLSLTVPGRGCQSDTCVMCPLPSYKNITDTNENIFQAIRKNVEYYKGKIDMLSLYTDGSYYDQKELDAELRNAIEDLVAMYNLPIFNIETLPSKFPEREIAQTLETTKSLLLINVGLQSSNNDIRKYCIGSPFTESHLNKMIKITIKHNIQLRSYLLFKPPFLSEYEAMFDLSNSIKYCMQHKFNIISINPCKVAKNTLLEYLYINGLYSVPHYFSIAKVLSENIASSLIRVEMPTSDGCPGDTALPHICDKCYYFCGEDGELSPRLIATPTCWDLHMKHEPQTGKWQERAERFWKSEYGKIVINF